MSDDRPSELLSQLPRSRPHRRSAKRPARPVEAGTTGRVEPEAAPAKTTSGPRPTRKAPPKRSAAPRSKRQPARKQRLAQPAQPRGVPPAGRPRRGAPADEPQPQPILRTAVQATAELAEIGMSLSARAVRRALSRFPRP